jgi:hypothetical protein
MRFKVAEFEAMKARLENGVIVTPEAYLPFPANDVIVTSKGYLFPRAQNETVGQNLIPLPQIKLSYFGKNEMPVIFHMKESYAMPGTMDIIALVDALSAANGAAFHAVATQPAFYALHPDVSAVMADSGSASWNFIKVSAPMDVVVGVWDVGGLHITFDGDAILHGVTERGEPTARNVREIGLGMGYDSSCSYHGTSAAMESKPVAGYAPSASAILRWAGKPMPGGARARAAVKTQQWAGKSEYDKVIAHEIDLNRDGVADFLVWQGRYRPQVTAEGLWEAIFANIDGQWQWLSYIEDPDCT